MLPPSPGEGVVVLRSTLLGITRAAPAGEDAQIDSLCSQLLQKIAVCVDTCIGFSPLFMQLQVMLAGRLYC